MTHSIQKNTQRLIVVVVAILIGSFARDVSAQQFWVYTRVTRPIKVDDKPSEEVVARSLTLFHAGRVYDWIPSVGEVTVLEPAHKRFVILSSKNMIATRVSFEEINRLIASARDETGNYADRLLDRGGKNARAIAEPLKFQLNPTFKETFSKESRELRLMSPRFAYVVDCREPEIPESLETYLSYTDWAARLNYVLHPQTLFPEPRLRLNQSLRKIKRIPSKVQLRVEFDRPLRLQAEHQFGWKLRTTDRQRINHWEVLLKNEKLEWMNFREYQENILSSSKQAKK
jgi:hypothetical protein